MEPFPTFRYHLINNTGVDTVTATETAQTQDTGWSDLDSMSIVANTGDYVAIFGGIMSNVANERVIVAISIDGVTKQESIAQVEVAADWRIQLCTMALLQNVMDGQLIQVRWKVSGGTGKSHRRSLILLKK